MATPSENSATIEPMAISADNGGPRAPPAARPEGELPPLDVPGRRSLAEIAPEDRVPFAIVAIGASAGGLDACTRLISALPPVTGMAFILVQHLDPNHESLMAGLLATHTPMTVVQATEAMPIESEHLYVIPPGTYLAVEDGALRLSEPQARHGARLPFDFLLNSLSEACAVRTACVVLSGTGADGSSGLQSLKRGGGLVIAQDPDSAEYDGMPRAAIETGIVDAVLPIARMPAALADFGRKVAGAGPLAEHAGKGAAAIIELLRTSTPHDFRLYKPGTLRRRIERRMEIAGIPAGDMAGYLDLLREDATERDLLAKDLLINVTSFFRDPKAFELLAQTVIPELIRNHPGDRAVRVWVPGCSSGEETYSIAMLFIEAIEASGRNLGLQLFASDVDPDAIATAREGLYPAAIVADLSAERLDAFFIREDHGYRVAPDLRAAIVFAVQDVLADPPFSRIDLVSCRNLLIYLNPEAQAKVIALFHFALRPSGILFLGSSETPGDIAGRFELISKQERLYRHTGRARPGTLDFAVGKNDLAQLPAQGGRAQTGSRRAALAELSRQTVLETHAPAAVLIDRKGECLYSLGAIERYLRVPSGFPTHDLLAMATPALRSRLRSAIRRVGKDQPKLTIGHNRAGAMTFAVDIQAVTSEGEELLLLCFIDQPDVERPLVARGPPIERARLDELQRELDATRDELEIAHKSIDEAAEEQKAANEEALSVNEEYQAANEELLTSKEELQSLNEELTALNSQLQETLDRERTTADDLQNVLYSTDIATLFLDPELKIRFFTPATRLLFKVIPGDVGRPLTDLRSLSADTRLVEDAGAVLAHSHPIEREIETPDGKWFVRRIMPYRVAGDRVEGVVITFTDITERKQTAKALEAAKRSAELANLAKSRFLAAASHDLRQPLQSLALLQALLAQTVEGEKPTGLVSRLGQTLTAMSGMLNALLDINQIEAGGVQATPLTFPIRDVLGRLRDEFAYQADAKRLDLRIVPSSLTIRSDPRLLEQMIRNLLSNALKYTRRGKVLVGCRRQADTVRIEIWDTGIGIAEADLQTIFDEFHQIGNAARERHRGLGLGLSIVQRLGVLLDHAVRVRSVPGRGSVFSIDVPRGADAPVGASDSRDVGAAAASKTVRHPGKIIMIEDDPEVRELLGLILESEGYTVMAAPDGAAALKLVAAGAIRPEIILSDYNLPGDMNGLALLSRLRDLLHYPVPGIILSGDISTPALAVITQADCAQLSKPVNASDLARTIEHLLAQVPLQPQIRPASVREPSGTATPRIFVVDDDAAIRRSIRGVLERDGQIVSDFADAEAFLAAYRPGNEACLLVDAYLPGMGGIGLLEALRAAHDPLPTILFTGSSDVAIAVKAMRAGASDFLEKPVGREALLASIRRALRQSHTIELVHGEQEAAARHLADLTVRQRQVLDLVLAGHPSKNIAADLGISQRTVENHRASIMHKTGARSLPELARLAVAAAPAVAQAS